MTFAIWYKGRLPFLCSMIMVFDSVHRATWEPTWR